MKSDWARCWWLNLRQLTHSLTHSLNHSLSARFVSLLICHHWINRGRLMLEKSFLCIDSGIRRWNTPPPFQWLKQWPSKTAARWITISGWKDSANISGDAVNGITGVKPPPPSPPLPSKNEKKKKIFHPMSLWSHGDSISAALGYASARDATLKWIHLNSIHETIESSSELSPVKHPPMPWINPRLLFSDSLCRYPRCAWNTALLTPTARRVWKPAILTADGVPSRNGIYQSFISES